MKPCVLLSAIGSTSTDPKLSWRGLGGTGKHGGAATGPAVHPDLSQQFVSEFQLSLLGPSDGG